MSNTDGLVHTIIHDFDRKKAVTEARKNASKTNQRKIVKISKLNPVQPTEAAKMDDLLQKYIEKVDRDQSDLKADLRESEKRVQKIVDDSERRMDDRLNRIENMINEQNKKIEDFGDKVSSGLRENKNFMWGITISLILSIIASIGVIIATYQATISLIQNMIVK